MTASLNELRSIYMGIVVFVQGARNIPDGNRTMYLEDCDGKTAVIHTSTGVRTKTPVSTLTLKGVLDMHGRELQHRIKDNVLLVKVDGEEVECCKWIV